MKPMEIAKSVIKTALFLFFWYAVGASLGESEFNGVMMALWAIVAFFFLRLKKTVENHNQRLRKLEPF